MGSRPGASTRALGVRVPTFAKCEGLVRRRAPAMHVYYRESDTAAFASAWLASLCFSDTNQRAAWQTCYLN